MKNIFQNYPSSIRDNIDLTKLEFYLESFFKKKILENDYMFPEEFGKEFGFPNTKFLLDLFLNLSQNKILTKYYYIFCDCGNPVIIENLDELDDSLQCPNCREDIEIDSLHNVFKNIQYVFKCTEIYKEEMESHLKVLPSSHHTSDVKEDSESQYAPNSIETVLNNTDSTFNGINTEKQSLEELENFILGVNCQ